MTEIPEEWRFDNIEVKVNLNLKAPLYILAIRLVLSGLFCFGFDFDGQYDLISFFPPLFRNLMSFSLAM